jgi:phage shock protein B
LDPLLIPITAIVCIFVVSPWLAFRHAERKRELEARETISAADADEFRRSLDRLERRVKTLESILDSEAPGWRKRHELEGA